MEEGIGRKIWTNYFGILEGKRILLFAPLCKGLHGRAYRSLVDPHYKSGKITNTLRFVFICANVCATRIIGV